MTVLESQSDGAAPEPRAQSKSAVRSIILRAGITVALCTLLLWHLDIRDIGHRLAGLDYAWTAAALATVFVAIVLSAWKWGLILEARHHPLPYHRLLRHYFVGLFFNNLLPTSIGGDAVRAWETSKDTGEVPESVGSVLAERLIAGVALGITATIGLPFFPAMGSVLGMVAFFLVVNLALVGLFLNRKIANTAVRTLLPERVAALRDVTSQTLTAVEETLKMRGLFLKVFALSIVFQISVAAVNACIFKAMGLNVSLAACIILTPMIFTVTMLPISISGMGVREAAYWFFFSHVGVTQADAIVASLAFFVIVAVASLPGAALFVHRSGTRRSPPTPVGEPQTEAK